MSSYRVFGSVEFFTAAMLERSDPDDWILNIAGRIRGIVERDGAELGEDENVGTLAALHVNSIQALNDGVSVAEVCDARGDLLAAYEAIFRKGEPKDELDIEPIWQGLLYLDSIAVKPEYRQSGVVVQALETTISSFAPSGIIAAHGEALGLTVDEWRELGFAKIARSPIVFRDNCSKNRYTLPAEDE